MSLTNPNLWARTSINRGEATITTQVDTIASDFSSTSTTFVNITGASIVVANRSGGKFHCNLQAGSANTDTIDAFSFVTISNGGTDELGGCQQIDNISMSQGFVAGCIGDTDGRTLLGRSRSSAGTATVEVDDYQMSVLEVSDADNLAVQRIDSTANFNTSSTSYVDVTNINLTVNNFIGGRYIALGYSRALNQTSTAETFCQLVHGTTEYIGAATGNPDGAGSFDSTQNMVVIEDTDGSTLKMQCRVDAGTGDLIDAVDSGQVIITLEFQSGGNTITDSMDVLTSDFTTTSTTFVDITGLTETLQSTGKFYTISSIPCANSLDGGFTSTVVDFGGTDQKQSSNRSEDTSSQNRTASVNYAGTAGGEVLKLQGRVFSASTGTWRGNTVFACRYAVFQID